MKTRIFSLVALVVAFNAVVAADRIDTTYRKKGDLGEITIYPELSLPVSGLRAEYRVMQSSNTLDWQDTGMSFDGEPGNSEEIIRLHLPSTNSHAFYRIIANRKMADPEQRLGSSVYGFGREFSKKLQQIGQMSLEQFSNAYPTPVYLEQISFDPTSAEYWTNYAAGGPFALNEMEFSRFSTNGFVVSQRLGSHSMSSMFYQIFTADLPVYISPDAILHAWHRSYIGMLEELEESSLSPSLELILAAMANEIPALNMEASGTALSQAVSYADHFLAVARSLATGTNNYGKLGQQSLVLATLTAISNQVPAWINLYGTNRMLDFSQFQVRGHYETSARLGRYFKAMMWCSLADFRCTGLTNDNSRQELAATIAMHLLLNRSGKFTTWKKMDDIIQMFVGPPDAMNFAHLSNLMSSAGISSPSQFPTPQSLDNLRGLIMSGSIGVQNIQSGYMWSPFGPEQIKLPRSFAVMPQRFTFDGWLTSQCTFDRIWWDENNQPDVWDKVLRRLPSALDVAFGILGNNSATPLIADRISNKNGRPFRDGYPYQHNLVAARKVLESQTDGGWSGSIYQSWIAALRGLSVPTVGESYPDVMRRKAWAMKTLNTQLASWTQLRHDTVLYAKQPYTAAVLCSYPRGFVEPLVTFWQCMQDLALQSRDLLATLPKTGSFRFEPNDPNYPDPYSDGLVSLGTLYTNRLKFLDNFASKMGTLKSISQKELARQPLTAEEDLFLEEVVETRSGYSGSPQYTGWYPALYYMNTRASWSGMYSTVDLWDALVTDVHTAPPDEVVGDPGAILHEAVGNVGLLISAVNWAADDVCIYAGPVMSHYEFDLPPTERITDSGWKAQLRAGNIPPQPSWTGDYLVPGNIPYYPW